MSHGLGRLYAPDERDIAIWQTPRRIDPEKVTRTRRYWDMYHTRLDQGDTPHCVGFGSTAYLFTAPVTHSDLDLHDSYAHALYYACKEVDGEPGAEDGTYVRSAMKVLKSRGLVDSYAFAWDLQSVVLCVLEKGPVVIGVDFYNSMYDPDSNYFIHVRKSSGLAGGHCMCITGVDTELKRFRLLNSWGQWWGKEGYCFMSFADMETLLNDNGEMAIAVELA